MKKLLLLTAILLSSCGKDPQLKDIYDLSNVITIPDSLKEQHRQFITETIRATHQNLSVGDYENIGSTVANIRKMADELYGINELSLRINRRDYTGYHYISRNNLSPSEKVIFDSLSIGLKKK